MPTLYEYLGVKFGAASRTIQSAVRSLKEYRPNEERLLTEVGKVFRLRMRRALYKAFAERKTSADTVINELNAFLAFEQDLEFNALGQADECKSPSPDSETQFDMDGISGPENSADLIDKMGPRPTNPDDLIDEMDPTLLLLEQLNTLTRIGRVKVEEFLNLFYYSGKKFSDMILALKSAVGEIKGPLRVETYAHYIGYLNYSENNSFNDELIEACARKALGEVELKGGDYNKFKDLVRFIVTRKLDEVRAECEQLLARHKREFKAHLGTASRKVFIWLEVQRAVKELTFTLSDKKTVIMDQALVEGLRNFLANDYVKCVVEHPASCPARISSPRFDFSGRGAVVNKSALEVLERKPHSPFC